MQKGIYPELNHEDLIEAFAQYQINITPQLLNHPTPEFVEFVFFACLEKLTLLNKEVLKEPVETALDSAQLPERDLYSAALTANVSLYHIGRMARAACIYDFNAKDLTAPQAERTRSVLSGLVNFLKFTEEYCEEIAFTQRESATQLVLERDRMEQKIVEVQEAIAQLQVKIDEDKPKREQLEAENKALTAQLYETKKVQLSITEEVERLRTTRTELVDRRTAVRGEIESLEQVIKRTNGRIVQHPERIRQTIATMTHTAQEDKKLIAMNEAKTRDLKEKISALLNIERDVRGCIEQLQTIEREVKALKHTQKELTQVKDALELKQIERNELRMKQERVKTQYANAVDRLNRAQKHAEEKKKASQRTIDRLHSEYAEMALERAENDRQVEELRKEANEVEIKMAEHLQESQAELNELLAEYWKLRHETDVFMETLANKLNMRVSTE